MRYNINIIQSKKGKVGDLSNRGSEILFQSGFLDILFQGEVVWLPLGIKFVEKIGELIKSFLPENSIPVFIYSNSRDIFKKNISIFLKKRVQSYKQLPLSFYQISWYLQPKNSFKKGVFSLNTAPFFELIQILKSKNNILNKKSEINYKIKNIFESINLPFGTVAEENKDIFFYEIDDGNDFYLKCNHCESFISPKDGADFSILHQNSENSDKIANESNLVIEKRYTPGVTSIDDLSKFLNTPPSNCIKSMLYSSDGDKIIVLVRGDRMVDEELLKKYLGYPKEFYLEKEDYIRKILGLPLGFIGPIGMSEYRVIADYSIKTVKNGVCGANEYDFHLINITPEVDFMPDEWAILTTIQSGDICPKCKNGTLIKKNITTLITLEDLSESGDVEFLDDKNISQKGFIIDLSISIANIIGVIANHFSDDNGILLPSELNIIKYYIIVSKKDNEKVQEKVIFLESIFLQNSIDYIIDDRDDSIGSKFYDSESVSAEIRLVISPKSIDNDDYSLSFRKTSTKESFSWKLLIDYINKNSI
ncbi:hypothetical protein JXR93_00065 [bacterium]|nr:hypothetical protein [bacterium]